MLRTDARNSVIARQVEPVMKHYLLLVAVFSLFLGCGPSSRVLKEQTLSTMNLELDRWNGGKEFKTEARDAYGRGLSASVEKGAVFNQLEIRSAGPDGLPKNTDDIVVTREERHGESTLTREASKATEGVAEGAASGVVKGIKKGLGLGKQNE